MRDVYIDVCVVLFEVELNLFDIGVCPSFYSSRLNIYIKTQGSTGDLGVVKIIYRRTLMARSSK
jgi:hypothetical protein